MLNYGINNFKYQQLDDSWVNYNGMGGPLKSNWWTAPLINTDINTSLNFPNTKAPTPNGQLASNTSSIINEILTEQLEKYTPKLNIFQKTGSFIGNNANTISQAADAVGNIANGINVAVGGKDPYDGPKGDLRATVDQGWNSVADLAGNFGPYGKLVQEGMKALSAVNNIQNAALGNKALDNMTTTDALLSSPLGQLVPGLGLVNALTGANANTITKNDEAFAQVGASFGGANNAVDEALKRSGKRYGGFSSGARKDANAEIAQARQLQSIIEELATESQTRNDLMGSMSSILSNRRAFDMRGGYNQSAIRVGKEGMSINPKSSDIFEILLESNISEISIFKDGGEIEEKEYLPKNPEEIIKFVNKHKKVNFVLRLKDFYRETIPDWEVEGNIATHKLAYAEDRGKIKVFPDVQEINGELYDFTNPEYKHGQWDSLESAEKNGDVIIFDNEDDAKWFTKHYKEYYPFDYEQKVNSFREGGSFNIIPDGSLHARLHHMENADNLTKKGIPVVSEKEGGELEQQAEIEKEEIILRLSLTKRLEELYKENTDEAAIEAGKLLVEEILNNTIDNTNLLNNIN